MHSNIFKLQSYPSGCTLQTSKDATTIRHKTDSLARAVLQMQWVLKEIGHSPCRNGINHNVKQKLPEQKEQTCKWWASDSDYATGSRWFGETIVEGQIWNSSTLCFLQPISWIFKICLFVKTHLLNFKVLPFYEYNFYRDYSHQMGLEKFVARIEHSLCGLPHKSWTY
jgi:hypothetical protein